MSTPKFSDGSSSAYTELPVPAAWLSWTRGNSQLRQVAKEDIGAFLGGWHAFTTDKDGNALPSLPLPIVERTSQDGKHLFKVYAFNFINFLPLQHRTRFELRNKVKDPQTGREYDRVVSISRERREGYTPYRQVFGLVFDNKTDVYNPAVLKVFKWSAFIAFEQSGQAWNKVEKLGIPEGQALIRRYGTVGTKEGDLTVPNFKIYGQGRSTPIEAVGISKPRFVKILPEFDKLWEDAKAWAACERWNAEGKVALDDTASDKSLFLSKCDDLKLSNIDVEQLIAEANGDYKQALANLSVGEEDPNVKFTEAEDYDPPF
jgi:hypothetical protein